MTECVSPAEIRRATLAFDEVEDRISLTCSLDNGACAVIWLTARMAGRLVPHLLQLVSKWPDAHRSNLVEESSGGEGMRANRDLADETMSEPHNYAEAITNEAPVVAGEDSSSWLLNAVDISDGPMLVQLCLRDTEGNASTLLSLEHTQLTQWLEGIKRCYVQAGWSMECWEMPASDYPKSLTTRHVALH